jgi:DnaJ-class molecular chaperone
MVVLILLAVIAVVGYLASLRAHPWRRCRACKGTGRHSGSVFKYSQRACASCGGNGRRARLGMYAFHGNRQVWGEQAPIRAAAKRSRNFGR